MFSYSFMAQIHMCLVLMLCDKPPFSIVSCPLGGLNFTVVPLAAVAVPPKPENRLPACVVVVPNRPPPPVDVLVAPNKPPPVLAVRTNQTCMYSTNAKHAIKLETFCCMLSSHLYNSTKYKTKHTITETE